MRRPAGNLDSGVHRNLVAGHRPADGSVALSPGGPGADVVHRHHTRGSAQIGDAVITGPSVSILHDIGKVTSHCLNEVLRVVPDTTKTEPRRAVDQAGVVEA